MIAIVPYRLVWRDEFEALGSLLRQTLGDLALRIDHIGSTSVPGLAAKDCIDIQIRLQTISLLWRSRITLRNFQKTFFAPHFLAFSSLISHHSRNRRG